MDLALGARGRFHPAVPQIDAILTKVTAMGASDVHFAVGSPLMVRHLGQLRPLKSAILTADQSSRFLLELLTTEQRARFEADFELDFSYEIAGTARFRASAVRQRQGTDLCFRIIRPDL